MTSEIVVIFGAAVAQDGRPSPALARRVAAAITYGKSRDAAFLVTGGAVAAATPEAEVMAALLRDAGIADARIIEEPYARNTLESVRRCLPLVSTVRRVVLCSDDFHLPRCRWLFALAGVHAASVAARPQYRRLWPIVREALAIPVDTVCWLFGR